MKYRNTFILHTRLYSGGQETLEHFICMAGCCKQDDEQKYIPNFFSVDHANSEGWGYSKSKVLLPEPGWMCPSCIKETGAVKLQRR